MDIKQTRLDKKVNVKKIEKDLNIEHEVYMQLEDDYKHCNAYLVYKVCCYLGVKLDNL